MINDIDIRNFKCFERLSISNCNRINVIVGDNGAGKTALLEAIFLALGGSSQLAIRFRQFRGLDGTFRGDGRKIEEAILRDYFHNLDMSKQISITLSGSGPEARSVYIGRKDSGPETFFSGTDLSSADIKSSIEFRWRDARGNERTASPTFSAENVKFPETGEDLPNFFFFAANQTFSSVENAERFSDLSRAKRVPKTPLSAWAAPNGRETRSSTVPPSRNPAPPARSHYTRIKCCLILYSRLTCV
ncbi:MAG: AAA family ATPase [Parvibaculum sp.]|uniref:AAA family ATPase n=1 Tax=Parvibaculum sp. TaxID=2024848 RepID=UPI00284ECDC4|nr:AAA family ATPase [Parvibaculum sp.]MDR3500010.1 AAA family ATPase [Parvibaculum sp.]